MISLESVTYTYKGSETPSLYDISLNVERGKTVLLAGKSGCGKTSILRLINGILLHDNENICDGKILIDGVDVRSMKMWEIAKKAGTVFQNPKSQFFNVDTTDEILFGLESMGISHKEMEETLEKVVDGLNISSLLDRNIFELSGGEKQRIAFASIYAMNPDIYIMDEPSSNLDEDGILKLRENIIRLKKENKTVLIAEHRLWYIADLVDDVYIIHDGRIIKRFSGCEFIKLSDKERREYGLRCIKRDEWSSLQLPEVENYGNAITNGLSIRNISARYRRRKVWENLNFDMPKGNIFAVIGHNGAGKSTLAKIICGLKKSCGGGIYWCGKKMSAKQLRNLCFMVMQDVNAQLFAESAIGEVMLDIQDSELNRKKACKCLKDCGLIEYKDRHPMSLSGGQKQRLAIADSISVDRKIVIFDEPTSGLDYCHMTEFVSILNSMATKDYVVIVITHDTEFIKESNAKVLSW